MSDIRCEDCKYFHRIDEFWGECRKNAPRPAMSDGETGNPEHGNSDYVAAWPFVETSDWCGEAA